MRKNILSFASHWWFYQIVILSIRSHIGNWIKLIKFFLNMFVVVFKTMFNRHDVSIDFLKRDEKYKLNKSKTNQMETTIKKKKEKNLFRHVFLLREWNANFKCEFRELCVCFSLFCFIYLMRHYLGIELYRYT